MSEKFSSGTKIPKQTNKQCLCKVGRADARHVSLLLLANQSDHLFQSEFGGYTIFTFRFKEEKICFINPFLLAPFDAEGTS